MVRDKMYSLFTSMAILMRPSSVPLYFCTSFLIPAILRRELTTHSGLVRRTLIQPEQEVTELYICLIMSLRLTCDTRKQKILDRLLILGPGEGFEAVEGVEVEEVGHGHAEEGGLAPAEQRGPALVPG